MTVEQKRSPGQHTCFFTQMVFRLKQAGIPALLIAVFSFAMYHSAAKANDNLWLAQVKEDSEKIPFRIADLTGPAGQQIRLHIRIPKQEKKVGNSVTFYGIPDRIILSAGLRKSKVWIVPVRKASNLTLIAPSGFQGRFEAAAILRKKNGHVIEGQRFVIKIMHPTKYAKTHKNSTKKTQVAKAEPAKSENQPKQVKKDNTFALSVRPAEKVKPEVVAKKPKEKESTPIVKEDPTPVVKKESSISSELEETLLSKSKQLLKDGNIVAARETLKFLAEQGNAESALLIAQTFDPEEFKNFNATGIEPDLAEAKRWYGIAAKLGAKGAKDRLKKYADSTR